MRLNQTVESAEFLKTHERVARLRNWATGSLLLKALAISLLLFLTFYNLEDYPSTWFDEGSHLHVPKTLARYGVYADLSSEGFRQDGPVLGVGPTVMIPIAASFKLFGIGLLQARIIMVLYMLGTLFLFYKLASLIQGYRFARVATFLILSSRCVLILQYGRQVLGEVPGLFFILGGLYLWFESWEDPKEVRLGIAGLLFGLAVITKMQYFLFVIPTMGIAWLLNSLYYKRLPHRAFLIPSFITVLVFLSWHVGLNMYYGYSLVNETLSSVGSTARGAAFLFSSKLIDSNLRQLLSRSAYLGALLPSLVYGFTLVLPRNREGQIWGVLFTLVVTNLSWYLLASVGWLRYAFLGLSLSSLFVSRFFHDLTNGFRVGKNSRWSKYLNGTLSPAEQTLRVTLMLWLTVIILAPLGKTVWELGHYDFNASKAMASYLNENIPINKVIETWEPELGFFTDHSYHYPPTNLLKHAIAYVWLDQPPVSEFYDFTIPNKPEYIVIGEFSEWTHAYPRNKVEEDYSLVQSIGDYKLYEFTQTP